MSSLDNAYVNGPISIIVIFYLIFDGLTFLEYFPFDELKVVRINSELSAGGRVNDDPAPAFQIVLFDLSFGHCGP